MTKYFIGLAEPYDDTWQGFGVFVATVFGETPYVFDTPAEATDTIAALKTNLERAGEHIYSYVIIEADAAPMSVSEFYMGALRSRFMRNWQSVTRDQALATSSKTLRRAENERLEIADQEADRGPQY